MLPALKVGDGHLHSGLKWIDPDRRLTGDRDVSAAAPSIMSRLEIGATPPPPLPQQQQQRLGTITSGAAAAARLPTAFLGIRCQSISIFVEQTNLMQ